MSFMASFHAGGGFGWVIVVFWGLGEEFLQKLKKSWKNVAG